MLIANNIATVGSIAKVSLRELQIDNFEATKDGWVQEQNPDTFYETNILQVRHNDGAFKYHTHIAFDMQSIIDAEFASDASIVVESATLSIRGLNNTQNGPISMLVYEAVDVDWTEGGTGPNDLTWNNSPAITGNAIPLTILDDSNTIYTLDITAIMQSAITANKRHFGIVITGDPTPNVTDVARFNDRTNGTAANRPQITATLRGTGGFNAPVAIQSASTTDANTITMTFSEPSIDLTGLKVHGTPTTWDSWDVSELTVNGLGTNSITLGFPSGSELNGYDVITIDHPAASQTGVAVTNNLAVTNQPIFPDILPVECTLRSNTTSNFGEGDSANVTTRNWDGAGSLKEELENGGGSKKVFTDFDGNFRTNLEGVGSNAGLTDNQLDPVWQFEDPEVHLCGFANPFIMGKGRISTSQDEICIDNVIVYRGLGRGFYIDQGISDPANYNGERLAKDSYSAGGNGNPVTLHMFINCEFAFGFDEVSSIYGQNVYFQDCIFHHGLSQNAVPLSSGSHEFGGLLADNGQGGVCIVYRCLFHSLRDRQFLFRHSNASIIECTFYNAGQRAIYAQSDGSFNYAQNYNIVNCTFQNGPSDPNMTPIDLRAAGGVSINAHINGNNLIDVNGNISTPSDQGALNGSGRILWYPIPLEW